MPVPTREGYTFTGWSGENLLNLEDYVSTANTKIENDSIIMDASHIEGNLGTNICVSARSTKYTHMYYIYWQALNNISGSAKFTKENTLKYIAIKVNTGISDPGVLYRVDGYVDGDDYTFSYNVVSYGDAKATINNVQINKGDTVKEYEPYQLYTKDTVVTKTEDHTLYANWEKNE